MMKELIWAEHQKLRRSKIVLVAIFAVIMVAIIVFTQGQFSFGEKRYIDDAGWFMNAAQSLATFLFFLRLLHFWGAI
ncbi:MAG: ABC transporter permease [Roseburia hominis]